MNKHLDNLQNLPNIGIKMEKLLKKIDINGKQQFLKQDPYKVFNKLLQKVDPTLCRCALASIVGANKGVVWHKITKKAAEEFDKLYPNHKWKNKC